MRSLGKICGEGLSCAFFIATFVLVSTGLLYHLAEEKPEHPETRYLHQIFQHPVYEEL